MFYRANWHLSVIPDSLFPKNKMLILKFLINNSQHWHQCIPWPYTPYLPDLTNSYLNTASKPVKIRELKLFLITNLTHFFMHLFISPLYVFRALQRSSSGDRIVLINHLVWLVCVSDYLVCRSGGISLLNGIRSSYLHRLIIPDYVLIQFDLLMMSTVMFETCR